MSPGVTHPWDPADHPDRRLTFEAIYEAFESRVYRFCMSQVRDPAVAEDITADTFVSAFRAQDRRAPDHELEQWIFHIARNKIVDHWRRDRRRRVLTTVFGQHADSGVRSIEGEAEVRSELRAAWAAMAQLNARDRQIVGLRVAGGLGFSEIGAIVNLNDDSARAAYVRALARVRQILAAEDGA